MGRVYRSILVGLFLMASLLGAATSRAQVVSGSVNGSVVDQTGAGVPDASVTITNSDTGAATQGKTTDTGYFRFVLLPIGTYQLTITKAGFEKLEVGGVKVNANEEYSAGALKIQLGAQTVTVEVNAAPPLVEACLLYTSRCV